MNDSTSLIEQARREVECEEQHRRRTHMWLAVVSALLVVLVIIFADFVRTSTDTQRVATDQRTDLINAVDLLRWQVTECANLPAGTPECLEPIAPEPEKVLDGSQDVPTTPPPPLVAEIDRVELEKAARDVITEVLPGEVAGEVDSKVGLYVAQCVRSGDCVGPAGELGPPGEPGQPGADGRTPSPVDIQAAVVAVCAATIDCEVTSDEIAAAVAAYCAQDGEPCGHRWTEAEIYKIANRATIDYLSGRPIWCPAENDVPNDQPFGPCYVSVG